MKKMIRTFHPVGHGAFYTERFYDEQDKPIFTAVFDCGSDNKKAVKTAINKEFANGNNVIDVLFISHFHNDHVNMIEELINSCKIKRIIIPLLSKKQELQIAIYNYINEGDNYLLKSLNNNKSKITNGETVIINISAQKDKAKQFEKIELGNINNDKKLENPVIFQIGCANWMYIPYWPTIKSKQFEELWDSIKKDPIFHVAIKQNDELDYERLEDLVKTNLDKLKKIYNKIFLNHDNVYSMGLFSGIVHNCHCLYTHGCNRNCLYTGDLMPMKNILETFYGQYLKTVRILQVPHHGSKHNLNNELYKTSKLCIISAGLNDKHGHPDQDVLDAIQDEKSIPIIVTENPKTMQKFEYDLY